MVKWGLAGALALALVVPAAGLSATHARRAASLSALDKHFLKTSAQGDAFEIRGGTMAQSKGQDTSIKGLGKTLVKDHTKSLSDVAKAAAKLGVKIEKKPSPPESWELSQAGSQSGKSFDQSSMMMHWDYVNEALPAARKDQIGWTIARVDEPGRGPAVSRTSARRPQRGEGRRPRPRAASSRTPPRRRRIGRSRSGRSASWRRCRPSRWR